MNTAMSRWSFHLLICFTFICAFCFTLSNNDIALADSPWHEHAVDSDFRGAEHIYAADVDGDGHIDILGAASTDNTIAWWQNDGNGYFSARQEIDSSLNGANCVYATDIDGDGYTDVLASAGTANSIVWYKNIDGLGNFSPAICIDSNLNGANYVYATDIDGDTDLDVLATAGGANEVAWYENTDGGGTFGSKVIIGTDLSGANCVYTADIDGDIYIDILVSVGGEDAIVWFERLPSEAFLRMSNVNSSSINGVNYVCAADIDGDGHTDVLASAGEDDGIVWFENDGTGTFIAPHFLKVFDGASSVYADDVDGDNDIDILGTALYGGDIAWWENNGSGKFNKHSIDTDFWADDPHTTGTGAKHIFTANIQADVDDDYINVVACSFDTNNGQVAWYSGHSSDRGDFIITATYGTPMAEEIDDLRNFRDQYLLTIPMGEAIVELYNESSPFLSYVIADHPTWRSAVRAGLKPVISFSSATADRDSAQKLCLITSIVLVSIVVVKLIVVVILLRRRFSRSSTS